MTTAASSPLTSLSQRLTVIVGALRGKVAAHADRDRTIVKLLTLAWWRLGRLASRFEVLVARVVAGRPFAPTRPRAPRPRVMPARVVARPAGVPRLPTKRAWLIDMVQETAQLRGHVEGLLADPGMVALLVSAPRAGRILRPLCHMLMIDLPPGLALPVRRRSAPEKSAPRKSRARVRGVKAASGTPQVDEPTAISLIWAAIRERAEAIALEPVARRKPPWRMSLGR